jgi:hypothetical protein
MEKQAKPKSELVQGIIILVVLGVLTGVEYLLATIGAPNIFLWAIAITKAAFILWFFMHIRRVIKPDGGHG